MSDSSRHLPLDPDSVDSLWHELHGRIRPRVGSADRADDVVQETFLNALRHPPPDPKGLGAWLQVVAQHLASRSRRRERSRLERERMVATARGSVKIEVSAPGVELREALRLLAGLEEPYRGVLRLRYLDGFEIEEIAHQLARSPGTVRSQIKRGLDRLRRRLGRSAARERRPWALALVFARFRDERWFTRAARSGALLASTGLCALVAVLLHGPRAPRASGPDPAPPASANVALVLPTAQARDEREHVSPGVAPPRAPLEPVEPWTTSLAGRVLEPEPAAGPRDARAWVPKAGVPILARGERGERERVVARSGADGRFRVDGVDGRDWIWACAEDGPASSMHLAASAEGQGELDLRIGRASASAPGRLLSADGVPIANATITVLGRPMRPGIPWIGDQGTLELSPPPAAVRTDEEGRFRFTGEEDEPLRLLVDAPGQPPALRLATRRSSGAGLELVLPRGGSVGGRLLTSDGAPAGGARLGLCLPQPLPGQEAVTDVAGWFRFERVPAGPYELVLLGDALGGESLHGESLHVGGTLREGEELERDVPCSPLCTIHGRALRCGAPLAGWSVELERMLTDDFPDRRSVTTDELGRFSFASCSRASKHLLRLSDPLTGRVLAWEKLEERVADDVCLAVDPLAAPARLVGTIESADPEHPAMFVEVWNNGLSSLWMAPVDARTGRYAFDDLPSGTHRVSAWLRGSGPVTFGPVDLGSGGVVTLDRRVERSGALRLQLDVPAHVRREQIEVVVTVPSLHSSNPRTTRRLEPGAPGAPFLAQLPPGDYEYSMRIDGVLAARRRFSIQSAQTTDDVVRVPDFVKVALELVAPRPLGEREPVSVSVLSDGTWSALGFTTHFHDAVAILLPVDATRLRIESRLGLVGEWTRAAPPYEGEVLEIALAPPKD